MKKILLFISMFLLIFNVKALTFKVNLTNIEDKGNNGTIGSITSIDLENREVNAFFQDIGDEVSFGLTIVNNGNKAGSLKSINITSANDKIEYTTNLPDGGLAISGNDSNEVIITAKVKEGAVNGTSSSEIKITYNYDEGSCPDGETLSEDESMCLCPTGKERNEQGVCIKPEKVITCKDDEIYNETKKICEKKVIPTEEETTPIKPTNIVSPSNPKTEDNIILIALLFILSGLGIYAVMFKKLKTSKQRRNVGIITGVITITLTFGTLASVFGIDRLLGAIVNPITRKQELVVTVNEEIDLIETWDGECSLGGSSLTAANIFEGGSGTKTNPYQIKTAEQLSCFAKSVNEGETYEGKYIKQTKNIKLNDKVLAKYGTANFTGLNQWIPIGVLVENNSSVTVTYSFKGTYDGDNKIISGLYIDDNSSNYLGFFRVVEGGKIKDLTLSDSYVNGYDSIGTLIAYVGNNSVVDNVKIYGKVNGHDKVAGIIGDSASTSNTITNYSRITNSENHADVTANTISSGITTLENIVLNTKNYGKITAVRNASGIAYNKNYVIDSENYGEIIGQNLVSGITSALSFIFGSDNYGKITAKIIDGTNQNTDGYVGISISGSAYDCNNYGDMDITIGSYAAGLGFNGAKFYNSGNTGTITAHDYSSNSTIYLSAMFASGATSITDENLSSEEPIQIYHDIMEKDFASRNTESYNTGDIYVRDLSANGFIVAMIGNSGSWDIYNSHSTGNIYVNNATASDSGSVFTMIATDGGSYTNVSSIGDMIIDNYNGNRDVYAVGIGTSGSTITNGKHEGNIEIKNSRIGGSVYNQRYNRYNYYYPNVAGGVTSGAYMENSYTKGEIKIHDNYFPAGALVGGVTASGAGATRSYSTMDIDVHSNISDDANSPTLKVASFATDGGRGITDCYNRGNISVVNNLFTTLQVGNRNSGMNFFGGNYNSGNYYVKDNYAITMQLGGFNSGPFFSNFYNLGDITLETRNNTKLTTLDVAGVNIMSFPGNTNLVNSGNISIPYISSITHLGVGGVFTDLGPNPPSTNIYNLGTISIGEGYTYSNNINYGNIYSSQSSNYDATGAIPSAYYTQDGYAMGLSRTNNSYAALDANYGTKIDASQAPSILSIINVNNAFEIVEGEELPTLKVFNQ